MFFLVNLLIATFIYAFFVLLNQMLRQNIYNARQIAAIHSFQNISTVSSRELPSEGGFQKFGQLTQKGLSVNFIDSLGKVGKSLCIVEIGGANFFQRNIADRVALFLSLIMGQKPKKQVP